MNYNGNDIIAMGIEPGPHIPKIVELCNQLGRINLEDFLHLIPPAKLVLQDDASETIMNIMSSGTQHEDDNILKLKSTMKELVKTPTVLRSVLMPDACPVGPDGTIPVGGVAVTENAIHPGMHSADVCCSMMVTNTGIGWNPDKGLTTHGPGIYKSVLDIAESMTHFGAGGRKNGSRFTLSPRIYKSMSDNEFLNLSKTLQMAHEHLGTQGDGNHFMYVGVLSSTGEICIVTHHGSRGVGAQLYKAGMLTAKKMTNKIAKGVLPVNYWITADSDEGKEYWDALQIVRKWTKSNHNVLHQSICDELGIKHKERFWNEHNFVFTKGDGLYSHAKGATPIDTDFLPDNEGYPQIVPLNMTQPVLLIRGTPDDNNLGFAPHGAGRNMSRTAHRKSLGDLTDQEVFDKEVGDIDARFYSGKIDVTELPSAYKNSDEVTRQMEYFKLAKVVDKIQPYGSIMAGQQDRDHWRKRK